MTPEDKEDLKMLFELYLAPITSKLKEHDDTLYSQNGLCNTSRFNSYVIRSVGWVFGGGGIVGAIALAIKLLD